MDRKQNDRIEQKLDSIISMLHQLLHPSTCMSIQEQAAAINKAIATGDRANVRAVLKQINGA